jgi:CheY-like chemotaxis protein
MKIFGSILVIDDDQDDHDILKAACASLGVCSSLKFFYSGAELVKYLKTSDVQPFIILCDINMPYMNGLDLREILWKDNDLRKRSIPFIFFSTSATVSQVKQAYDLTVQGFFLKGNTFQETVRKLKLILEYWTESKHPNSIHSQV